MRQYLGDSHWHVRGNVLFRTRAAARLDRDILGDCLRLLGYARRLVDNVLVSAVRVEVVTARLPTSF